MPTENPSSRQTITAATDQCVKCGLCLPHCPTYGILQDEGDSPRGRIALMQGLAAGDLPLTDRLQAHLDRCLVCRACEQACPARVPFQEIIITTRHLIADREPADTTQARPRIFNPFLDALTGRPTQQDWLHRLLQGYRYSGIQWLLRRSGVLSLFGIHRLEGYIKQPGPSLPRKDFYPATGQERGRVALFHGCLGRVFDTETLKSTIALLNHCGFSVEIPAAQGCCGALPLHHGEKDRAIQCQRSNLSVFSALEIEAVIVTSTACAATLMETKAWPQDAPPIVEICQFMARKLSGKNPIKIECQPLDRRVALHQPCSQLHGLRDPASVRTLLSLIPGLEICSLTRPHEKSTPCCGGAGRYMVDQAALSDQLRDEVLTRLEDTLPDMMVTSNIGCALHLTKGIREQAIDIPLLHPITLLNQQIKP